MSDVGRSIEAAAAPLGAAAPEARAAALAALVPLVASLRAQNRAAYEDAARGRAQTTDARRALDDVARRHEALRGERAALEAQIAACRAIERLDAQVLPHGAEEPSAAPDVRLAALQAELDERRRYVRELTQA